MIVKCSWCGKEIERWASTVKERNFCSRACLGKAASKKHNPDGYKWRDFSINSERMREMNAELNPKRMTPATRQKIREARLGTGAGKTYTKIYGRHEHRVVAEQMLGRPLRPGEVVHHMDGDKRNNAPENLMVFKSQKIHVAFHVFVEGNRPSMRGGDAK